MTTRKEILMQKLCESINLQSPRSSDERKLRSLVSNFGMILPDFEQPNIVGLNRRQTEFFKNAAQFQVDEKAWSNPKDLTIGYLGEFAFHLSLCFRGRRHKWASIYIGSGREASLDFTVWRKGKRFTIGVRSSPHLDYLKFFNKPIVFYPADRLENAKTKIASFIVPASVFKKDDGSTDVAFWGAGHWRWHCHW